MLCVCACIASPAHCDSTLIDPRLLVLPLNNHHPSTKTRLTSSLFAIIASNQPTNQSSPYSIPIEPCSSQFSATWRNH